MNCQQGRLNRSENIPKSFRGGGGATFFKHPVVYLVVFIVQYVTAHQTCRKKVCTGVKITALAMPIVIFNLYSNISPTDHVFHFLSIKVKRSGHLL